VAPAVATTAAATGSVANVVKEASKKIAESAAPAKGFLGKAGKALFSSKGALVGGGVLSALFLGSTLSKRNKDTALAERLDRVQASTPEDILRNIQRNETLALREGRLAQRDPAAYESLRQIASGQGTTQALARGEFIIGGGASSGGRVLQSGEVQEILAALTGE